jgi:tetratricopeptide (TPR) repeat protein
MLTQKCTDSPLALEAAIAINENEPNFAIAKFIGSKSAQDGDKEKATEYYNRAIDLTDDNTKKSEIYLSLARIQSSNGDKVSSRGSARRALAFDPSYLDAYKLIGDLYMTSFDDCKGGESKVVDRGIFIAAYDMYQKAGNRESMVAAKAQFPSIEEIFSENYEEGQMIKVDCWINQSVKIERRPSN